jgi:nucleotide-binding universal stress UspA family protein
MMLHTILVPLDGSDLAARAVPYASALAGSAGTKLVLMRALPLQGSGRLPDDRDEALADLTMDAAVLKAIGVSAETVVRRIEYFHASDIAESISTVAEEQRAELIVMSTHGRSGLGRWLYGSATDSVLRRTSTPVLLVPPHAERALPTDRPMRLLVTLDGSELAEEAIVAAELLAGTTDAELHLLRVVEPPSYPLYGDGYAYIPYDADIELAEARRYLQVEVDRLQTAGKRVTARAVVGQPSSMVAQVARDAEVDIITMATHGRSGLARLVLGSVATATVQRADVPVLLVRPAAMRHTEKESDVAPGVGAEGGLLSASTDQLATPTVGVQLCVADLELIERGLKTLAFTPGYDYHLAPRVYVLLDRLAAAAKSLETDTHTDAREPATAQ